MLNRKTLIILLNLNLDKKKQLASNESSEKNVRAEAAIC